MYRTITILLVALVTACGSGSSDDGGSSPPPNLLTLSGTAFDAALRDSTVRVYDWSGGVKGAELGSGKTDSVGRYSMQVPALTGPVFYEAVDGFYFEEASNTLITLDRAKGHQLSAVAVLSGGAAAGVNLTGSTTMAAGLAHYLVKSQGMTAQNAVLEANQRLSAWVGFDIHRVVPLAATDPGNATAVLSLEHKYGFLSAAVSELAKRVDEAAFRAPHSQTTSIGFYQVAFDDIRADGKLDGLGAGGALMLDNVPVNSDLYRATLAERMLQFVLSDRNDTNLDFNTVLPYAVEINTYTDETFGNTPPVTDIRNIKPSVTNLIPPEGATISGSYNANAMVSDAFGLKLAQYFVDGMFVATAGSADNPVRAIVTRNFPNGAHSITIEVTNILDNKTSLTHNVTFQN